MEKLLLIKLSALGDLAQVEPFLPCIADKYQITLLTSPVGYAYYQDNENINDFIVLEDKRVRTLLKTIPKYIGQYDVVLDLQGNDRSAVLSFFSFKPVYGCHTKYYRYEPLSDYEKKFIVKASVLHRVTLSTIKQLPGVDVKFPSFAARHGEYIVLNMGASPGWESKRIPAAEWRKISRYLTDRYGLPYVLTGSSDEFDYIETTARQLVGKYENLAGKTSMQDLKKILAEAALTVSTDSGPMQISAVKQTPTIGLFGATNWIRSAPFGYWSKAVFSKQVYADGIPPETSLRDSGSYYSGIDVRDGIAELDDVIKQRLPAK